MNEVTKTIEKQNAELIRTIARTITSTSKRQASLYSCAAKIVEQINGNNVQSVRLVIDTFNGIKTRIDVKNEFTLKAWNNFRSMFLRQCKAGGYIVKVTQKGGIYDGATISVLITDSTPDNETDDSELEKGVSTREDAPKHLHGLDPAMDKIAAIMAAYEVIPAQVAKHLIEDMSTPEAVKLMASLGFVRMTAAAKKAA